MWTVEIHPPAGKPFRATVDAHNNGEVDRASFRDGFPDEVIDRIEEGLVLEAVPGNGTSTIPPTAGTSHTK